MRSLSESTFVNGILQPALLLIVSYGTEAVFSFSVHGTLVFYAFKLRPRLWSKGKPPAFWGGAKGAHIWIVNGHGICNNFSSHYWEEGATAPPPNHVCALEVLS